jgi:tetratricopeptide (TPR) repeat protein
VIARHVLILAAGLIAFPVARASADRVAAEAHYGIAQKARESGDLEQAEAALRKAVDEDAAYLPARLALGEALLARGNMQEGIAEMRAAGALAADPAASAAWPNEAARARKRVQELEATAAALAAKVEKHVAECVALAARWAEKDPDLARRALRRALRLVPEHADASERLKELTPVPKGETTALFLSQEGLEHFGLMDGWKIEGGNVSVASGLNGGGLWVRTPVSGDFDFRAEARLVEGLGHPLTLGLSVIHGVGDISSFAYREGKVKWEELPPDKHTVVFEHEPSAVGYDPTAWTPFEMRFRGTNAEAWLNGKRVGQVSRRNPSGSVMLALRWQQAKVEYRRVEMFVPESR